MLTSALSNRLIFEGPGALDCSTVDLEAHCLGNVEEVDESLLADSLASNTVEGFGAAVNWPRDAET